MKTILAFLLLPIALMAASTNRLDHLTVNSGDIPIAAVPAQADTNSLQAATNTALANSIAAIVIVTNVSEADYYGDTNTLYVFGAGSTQVNGTYGWQTSGNGAYTNSLTAVRVCTNFGGLWHLQVSGSDRYTAPRLQGPWTISGSGAAPVPRTATDIPVLYTSRDAVISNLTATAGNISVFSTIYISTTEITNTGPWVQTSNTRTNVFLGHTSIGGTNFITNGIYFPSNGYTAASISAALTNGGHWFGTLSNAYVGAYMTNGAVTWTNLWAHP